MTFTAFDEIIGGTGIDTLAGRDVVNVWMLATNNSGNLNSMLAFSSIEIIRGGAGDDTLIGANIVNTWNLSGTNAGNLNAALDFSAIENLTGNSFDDVFVFGDQSGVTGRIDAMGGAPNTFNYSAYSTPVTVNLATGTATGTGGFANIHNLIGGLAHDWLVGDDIVNTWNITTDNTGYINAPAYFTFTSIEDLVGGDKADTFIFTDGKGVAGFIDGGPDSNNTLDYSAYSTAICVNLRVSTAATQVAARVTARVPSANVCVNANPLYGYATNTSGVTRIQNVIGGAAGDILIGDAQNNILTGNAGDDILVGGSGNDELYGGPDSEVYIFEDGFGQTLVVENANDGNDTLDFTLVTTH